MLLKEFFQAFAKLAVHEGGGGLQSFCCVFKLAKCLELGDLKDSRAKELIKMNMGVMNRYAAVPETR